MEYLQLCQQLKSLASQMMMTPLGDQLSQLSKALKLNDIQVSAIYADSMIVLFYLILLISKTNAARFKILTAFLLTLVVAYSPLYDVVSDVGYHCALAVIYVNIWRYVTNKQIKYTLVIMVIFQTIMAIDSYANPTTETWLYRNFEEITVLIHFLIFSSCFRLKPIDLGAILGRIIVAMRGLSYHYCLTSRL